MLIEREKHLRTWCIVSMILVLGMIVVPPEVGERVLGSAKVTSLADFAIKCAITVALLVAIPGFYVRMLYECGFAKHTRLRGAWLALLLLLPILSVYIYYWTTRSKGYRERWSNS